MSAVDTHVDDRSPDQPPGTGAPEAGSGPATSAYTVRRVAGFVVPMLGQFLLLFLLLTAYKLGRRLAADEVGAAFTHATEVWRFERLLHFPREVAAQSLVLHWPGLVRAANRFYVSVHFPATVAFLIWFYLRHRNAFARVRTVLIMLTASALVIHIAYPLAPPRMIGHGLVDTAAVFGPSPYADANVDKVLNQYAAMPSLHIGWALLIAWAICRYGTSRARWLIVLYPALVTTVVVVTANHYWLDGVVAAGLLAASIRLTRRLEGRPPYRPSWAVPPAERVPGTGFDWRNEGMRILSACGAMWSGGSWAIGARVPTRGEAPRAEPYGPPRQDGPPLDDRPAETLEQAGSGRAGP